MLEMFKVKAKPPKESMETMFAFLAKGDDPNDSVEVGAVGRPADTRPLQLGNTDMKLCSKALNAPLSDIAATSVAGCQRGFVRGR